MKAGYYLGGLTLGLIIGGIAGYAIASDPRKKEKIDGFIDDVGQTAYDLKEKAGELTNDLKHRAGAITREFKQRANEFTGEVKEKVEEFKEEMESSARSLKEDLLELEDSEA